jgi:hypothetical protein
MQKQKFSLGFEAGFGTISGTTLKLIDEKAKTPQRKPLRGLRL